MIEEIVHSAEFLGGKEDSELGEESAKFKLVECTTLILVVFLEKQDGVNQTKEKRNGQKLTRKMPLHCSRLSTPLAKSWFLTLLQIISNLFLQSAIVFARMLKL